MTPVRPVRRQVFVGASPVRAFALFTERIGEWWPMADHSVFGDEGTVAFERRELVERAGDRVAVWAEVTAWEPPAVLALAWHPGRRAEVTTPVRVTFEHDGREWPVARDDQRLMSARASPGYPDDGRRGAH